VMGIVKREPFEMKRALENDGAGVTSAALNRPVK